MNSVVTFPDQSHSDATTIIVFVDMQREYQDCGGNGLCPREREGALVNCRRVLAHARRIGLPIAFARRSRLAAFSETDASFSGWIDGFAPRRDEMVFDRHLPSCYASRLYASFADHQGMRFVLAGLSGESACLSTMIDAHHRGHHVTFLADASASIELNELNARETHRAVCCIGRLYGEVCETEHWMAAAVSRRVHA